MGFNIGQSLHPTRRLGVDFVNNAVTINTQDYHDLTVENGGGSLFEYLSIWGEKPVILTPAEKLMLKLLHTTDVNLIRLLPKRELKTRLQRLNSVLEHTRTQDKFQWLNIYKQNRAFLDSLLPFCCNEHDDAQLQVNYSLENSITGRLTVSQGPNVLTTTPDLRKLWCARSGTPLVELDIRSLEPTILFNTQIPDLKQGDDLYNTVNSFWFDSGLTRELAKQVTISLCYGASVQSLEALGAPRHGIKKMIEDLRLNELGKQLAAEFKQHGRIFSLTGRPIYPKTKTPRPGALINNYIQSTGVDVSLSLFAKICKQEKCKPHIVVHDAVFVSDLNLKSGLYNTNCDILKAINFNFTVKREPND
jgi:hypothetical protein